jgi:hypothetical protein
LKDITKTVAAFVFECECECQENYVNYLRLLTKTLIILVSEWLGIHISFSLKHVSKILKFLKDFYPKQFQF